MQMPGSPSAPVHLLKAMSNRRGQGGEICSRESEYTFSLLLQLPGYCKRGPG